MWVEWSSERRGRETMSPPKGSAREGREIECEPRKPLGAPFFFLRGRVPGDRFMRTKGLTEGPFSRGLVTQSDPPEGAAPKMKLRSGLG
jgi:hypothetical protein